MAENWIGSDFEDLKGKTLVDVRGLREGSELVEFECADGSKYQMYHVQDCCESVCVEDVCGSVDDLLNTPIVDASERTSENGPFNPEDEERSGGSSYDDLQLWTFYRISTIKGTVVIRWYGHSNGYYGVGVSFYRSKDATPADAEV